jgi:lipopolysaccharide heptosyltransferase II
MKSFLVELASRLLHPLLSSAPGTPPNQAEFANILVIKPASIGDVLMSTAFLAALRGSLPNATIRVMVTNWAKAALAGNPHCNHVLDSGSVGFPGRYGLSDYRRCVAQVRQEQFTHCFVLDRSPLMALLPRLAEIPWRAGLNNAHRGVALHVGVPCPTDRHEAEVYLDVLRAVGLEAVEPRLYFQPQPQDVTAMRAFLEEQEIDGATPLIAIHAGGGRNPGEELVSKRWSSRGFAAVADRLARGGKTSIALVGGSDDVPSSKAVLDHTNAAAIDATGKLTFAQLGALLAHSDVFIGNDSAPMHLAAAVRTPVVALFGPTPPERYGPYGVQHEVVRFNPNQSEEADRSEVEAVADATAQLLQTKSRGDLQSPGVCGAESG